MTETVDHPYVPRLEALPLVQVPPLAGFAMALLLAVVPIGGVGAQMLCSKPVAPICATTIPATRQSNAVDQKVARQRCIEDTLTYRERFAEYRGCLEASVETAGRELAAADAFLQCLRDEGSDCRMPEPE